VGAAVVLRGVNAGRVQRIELGRRLGQVMMALDPDVGCPRSVVLLNESSLFGEWQTITEEAAIPRDEAVSRQIADSRGAGGELLPGATLPDIAQLTAVAGRIGDVASVASRVEVAFDDQARASSEDRSRTSRRSRPRLLKRCGCNRRTSTRFRQTSGRA
jgi:hypothetical protein